MFFERKVLSRGVIVFAPCSRFLTEQRLDGVFVGILSGRDHGVAEDHAVRAVGDALQFRVGIPHIAVMDRQSPDQMPTGRKAADQEFFGVDAKACGVFPDIADRARNIVERLLLKRNGKSDVRRVGQHEAIHASREELFGDAFALRGNDHAVPAAGDHDHAGTPLRFRTFARSVCTLGIGLLCARSPDATIRTIFCLRALGSLVLIVQIRHDIRHKSICRLVAVLALIPDVFAKCFHTCFLPVSK